MGFINSTVMVAIALLSSCCIKAAAEPPCNSFFPSIIPSLLSNKDPSSNSTFLIYYDYRTPTLFKQSALSFPTYDHPLSFTFTASYSRDDAHYLPHPPRLAFILARSQLLDSPSYVIVQSMELSLIPCNTEFSNCSSSLHVCDSTLIPPQMTQANCSCEHNSLENEFSVETHVSLTYNADVAAVHVQTIDYSRGFNPTIFSFSLHLLDSTNDSTVVSNDIITLFVGYITSGEATINVTVTSEGSSAKSNHLKVVVWVIVGVSMVGIFVGFLILVFFITKRRRRPSLISSHPAGHGAPPSATSTAPFSHHDFEYGATPMMRALPLSPPYTDGFQISGTTSWLKQPNPR